MPTVRYQIRNVYGLADPEVYRAADKDDPEALLEGVEMAGLVGVLRQLGDLAEFAAEVFHDLHEEVMATSSRGHGLMLRLQQLEAEFPSIEKVILSETDHSHCAYSAGIDWHANLRVHQNLVIQGDMPRFILDSYEECRGSPRLFMLDKFDVAGAGACLTRYSNPSFFKIKSASTEMMESEMQREKRARKPNKKGSYWRSGETTESFFTPIIDNSQFTVSEPVPDKFPARLVKLKHRKLRVSDISSRKSYMDGLLKKESFEENDPKSSLSSCHNNKSIDWAPEVLDVLIVGVTDPLLVRKEFAPLSPKEVTEKVQNQKREAGEFLETVSISSCVSQKLYQNSQNAKDVMLVGHGNEMGIHAFDVISDENDTNLPLLEQAVQSNLLADSGFITDDDHDSYRSDDIGSDLENYVDALNAMESELESDSENRAKSDPSLFNLESQGTNLNINGHIELQPRFSGSGFAGSFDTSKDSEKVKDGMPSLSQSTILVDLPYQQLQVRTVFEEISSEINQGETGMLERTSEGMELVPSACLTSNETCCQKQPNATMVVPISREAFTSSCITDSALKSKPNFEEAQSVTAGETISGSTKSTPEVDENVESSFLPWQKNYVVVFPTCKEHPDVPTDILEEINAIEHSQDRISATITYKDYMPCDSSETEHGILPEKAPAECFKDSPLTLMDDEIGKPLEMSEPDKNDFISGTSSTIPMDSTVLEYQDTSNDLEIDMQSQDLSVQISPNYMEGCDGEGKQLNSSVLFPAETHELPLVVSDDSGSYGSTQTSENVDDDLAYISDERDSSHGSQNNSVIGQLSGYTEKTKSDDMANTFGMPEPPQLQAESSIVEVSSVYVKDSLHDSVEDNETYSVEKLSPKSSAFSLEIVSSIPQSESLAAEIRNISVSREEFEHPQSPSSSENVDILGCNASISAAIPYELEHFPDAEEIQVPASGGMLEPLPSGCREDSAANQLQPEVYELVETNGKEHVNDGLEFANGFTKFSVNNDPLLLVESKKDNNSLSVNVITKDSIDGQVLNMLESAKGTTFDELLQEKPLSKDDTLPQPEPDIEEPAITRHSTSLQSENKSFLSFTRNEELEMLINSVSRCQSSALDLSNSSEAKLVDVKGDTICSRENEQDSDSKSENIITEDDTYSEVLSLLLPSNICNFDVQFQEDPVSEDAVLNLQKPVIVEFDSTNSDSKFNSISQVGTDGQILSLLESSNVYFDVQIQEDPVSEDASLNQHKPEIEEPAITGDLTSLKFESNLFVPLYENGDQKSVNIVSSSQLLALDLSNLTDAKLAAHDFDDIHMEESLIYSREDEQDSDSDASRQHFQADAERPEVQSDQVSISQEVDEPSTSPLYRDVGSIEPSYIHLDEVCSDEPTIIQFNLEHEGLLPELDSETFLGHGSNNELNVPWSKTHENEQEKNVYVPLQGVSAHPGSSMASKPFPSGSPVVADFMISNPITSTQEHLQALPGETISSLPLQEDIKETPPLPPLPPMQWRMSKPQLGSIIAGGHIAQPVMETNPFIFTSNIGSMHINPLTASKEKKMDQHTNPFVSPAAFKESFQDDSSCTDGQMTEYLKLSEFPAITLDQRQQLENHSSGLSLIVSSEEDGEHSHGNNITMDGENPFTVAPSLKDVIPQYPDVLEAGTPQTIEELKPKLVKLLPGLELERSQETPKIDRDAIPPLSSFMFMPTMGDGMYQYAYGDNGGYEGESMQYHNLSAPFPVAGHSVPHYGYHMFIRKGNSSSIYDVMLPEMEGDKPSGNHRSIRNRPRDPLIEAVAAHDKSTLRKVSELNQPLTKPEEDERNYLLEQIKNKSSSLKPATSAKANMLKAPTTNLKVAAILEKANAIRQACVGSDEDEDDNWNDS